MLEMTIKKTEEVTTKEVLEHILIICKIYESSTDKIGRIQQYAEFKLSQIEGETNGKKANRSKGRQSKVQ